MKTKHVDFKTDYSQLTFDYFNNPRNQNKLNKLEKIIIYILNTYFEVNKNRKLVDMLLKVHKGYNTPIYYYYIDETGKQHLLLKSMHSDIKKLKKKNNITFVFSENLISDYKIPNNIFKIK